MMKSSPEFFIFFFLMFGSLTQGSTKQRFDGYKVFEVEAKNQEAYKALVQLRMENNDYDFWTEPRSLNRPMDIMISPTSQQEFLEFLNSFAIEQRIKIFDVQKWLEEGERGIIGSPQQILSQNNFDGTLRYSLNWTSYFDYPYIEEFIKEMATTHSNLVTVINIATIYEGNDIYVVKISNPRTDNGTKKAIYSDAGIHAREWISPAFATWLIHELVENYLDHPQYVDNIDWFIIPVLNPDGYRFSFSDNRLWRKNRSPNDGSVCEGTDLNRNYGFHWNEGGSSPQPCSEVYHGGAPFNQIESQAVRDFVNNISERTPIYLALHSWGQSFGTPWGYTSDYPENYQELYDLAERAIEKLSAVYGTKYDIFISTDPESRTSGCSDDWAKGVAQIPYAYTIEMRDNGTYGFRLPADQIIPNNLEIWEAMKVIAEFFF